MFWFGTSQDKNILFISETNVFVGIIGFIIWNKKDEKDIKKCSTKERIIYSIIIAVSTEGLESLLKKFTILFSWFSSLLSER